MGWATATHADCSRSERVSRIDAIKRKIEHNPISQDDARFLMDEIYRLRRFESAVWTWQRTQGELVKAEGHMGAILRDHYDGAPG